jgi:hypothetical protein
LKERIFAKQDSRDWFSVCTQSYFKDHESRADGIQWTCWSDNFADTQLDCCLEKKHNG